MTERKGVGGRQKRGSIDYTFKMPKKQNLPALARTLQELIGNEAVVEFDQANLGLDYTALCQAYVDRIAKARHQEAANKAMLIADQQDNDEDRHQAQVSAAYIELNGGWLCEKCLTVRADAEESCGNCATNELQDILAFTH